MKKRIALDQIKTGSRFSADLCIDDDNILVPANLPVKQRDLDAMKRWGIAFVLTEGGLIDESAKASTPKPSLSAPQAAKASPNQGYPRYMDLEERLAKIFERIRKSESVESKSVDAVAQGVISLVRDERDEAISAVLAGQACSLDLAMSAVNIAILSTVVGIVLKIPPYRLAYLSLGALLHDIGMLRVPDSIVKKQGLLTEDEAQKIRAHPLLSYRIITKELLYSDDVGLIGLQHHERWDAEGYPRRTPGPEIDVLSRIVSVADAFEAMVSVKPYRSSMIGYAAMKALLSDNSRRFDPDIIKSFIRSMGIYPLGSTVLLNNAAIARVVETHPEAPLRPKLKVIVDEFGKRYEANEGDTVDLIAEKSLFIARALDPKELAGP